MKYIDEVNLKNKTVIVRVDYNVPLKNNKITDNFRIISSINTINYLLENNCKIILLSHLGKIKEKKDKKTNDMKIVYKELKKHINSKIYFSKYPCSKSLTSMSKKLKPKEIILVQNTRYMDLDNKKESNCDEELSKYWASLADLFVMDAFATAHREHASTCGIMKYLPTCYGFLIKKEIEILDEVINKERKTLIIGGAKVSDKILLIENLINSCEKILIGGKMCFTFLEVLGNKIAKPLIEEDKKEYVNDLLSKYKEKIILPIDFVTESKELKKINEINTNDNILDLGKLSIKLFEENINKNNFVIWNGPLGYVEDKNFEKATVSLLEYLNNNKIKTVIAGGDTANVANKYKYNFYHISTGGGATLKYLEGKELKALGGKYEKDSIK